MQINQLSCRKRFTNVPSFGRSPFAALFVAYHWPVSCIYSCVTGMRVSTYEHSSIYATLSICCNSYNIILQISGAKTEWMHHIQIEDISTSFSYLNVPTYPNRKAHIAVLCSARLCLSIHHPYFLFLYFFIFFALSPCYGHAWNQSWIPNDWGTAWAIARVNYGPCKRWVNSLVHIAQKSYPKIAQNRQEPIKK